MDDDASICELDEVTMAPCPRIGRKVAVVETCAIITPQAKRHGGHRIHYDKLTNRLSRNALNIPGLYVDSESWCLYTSYMHIQSGRASNKDGGDICAPTHRAQPDVTYILINPSVSIRGKWRTGN